MSDSFWDGDQERIDANLSTRDGYLERYRQKKAAKQLGFDLPGGSTAERLSRGELDSESTLPPGPYTAGMTHWISGDGESHEGIPYTVRCGDGRAVAGHIPSREIAEAIAEALNRFSPL